MDKITPTIVVLTATVLGMYNCIQVVEVINHKRDIILDIDESGERLTLVQKRVLLDGDWRPLNIGVLFFLAIYTGAFAALPGILKVRAEEASAAADADSTDSSAPKSAAQQRSPSVAATALDKPRAPSSDRPLKPLLREKVGCWAVAAFGVFAFAVQFSGFLSEKKQMENYLTLHPNPKAKTDIDVTIARLKAIKPLLDEKASLDDLMNELHKLKDAEN